MSPPALRRRRKAPRQLEVGEGVPEYAATAEDHYQRIYFEVIDMLFVAIQEWFRQKEFQVLQKLEKLVIENCPSVEILREVAELYGSHFHHERLKLQLNVLHSQETNQPLRNVQSVVSHLRGLNDVEKEFYSEIIKVVKLILV